MLADARIEGRKQQAYGREALLAVDNLVVDDFGLGVYLALYDDDGAKEVARVVVKNVVVEVRPVTLPQAYSRW